MMEDRAKQQIIRDVIGYVCGDTEPRSLTDIHRNIRQRCSISREELKRLIHDYDEYFEVSRDGQSFVRYMTMLSLCESHSSRGRECSGNAPQCTGLHICKFFVLSNSCKFKPCLFGHDLTTAHNRNVLQENLLDHLPLDMIKHVLNNSISRDHVAKPKICKFYNIGEGVCRYLASDKRSCPHLHLCSHYIYSNCKFGSRCKRSHDVLSQDVHTILGKHGIDVRRSPKEILADLRRMFTDNEPVPNIQPLAPFSPQAACGKMPGFSQRPVSSPAFTQKPAAEACRNAGAIPKTVSAMSLQQEAATDTSRQLVCLFHLKGCCMFGQKKCFNYHCDLPYQWLCMDGLEQCWKPVHKDENMAIELQYSDPAVSEYFLVDSSSSKTVRLSFKTMKGTDGEKQMCYCRLSTQTSAILNTQPLATRWSWYWKDQMAEWKLFGQDVGGYRATISSTEIEQAYIANPDGQMSFCTAGHEYVLDFKRMLQKNLNFQTEREVNRRPQFVTKEQCELRKRQPTKDTGVVSGEIDVIKAPAHWTISPGEQLIHHFTRVTLDSRNPSTQREYKEIEKLFCESMPSTVSIKQIDRIENGDLWYNYESKRVKMCKRNNDQDVVNQRLFHGTDSQYVDAICQQGFDFRLSGTSSGTRYGKGSYFATTSKYSNSYTDSGLDNKIIFIAKVLVGQYVQGKKEYCRPPPKNPADPCSLLYDSCVDDLIKPKIFVIFENGQVYPEYLVKYDYKFTV